jgi:hypothetical protein
MRAAISAFLSSSISARVAGVGDEETFDQREVADDDRQSTVPEVVLAEELLLPPQTVSHRRGVPPDNESFSPAHAGRIVQGG